MKITKKNGVVTVYDDQKVAKSILKANEGSTDQKVTQKNADGIASEVFSRLTEENEIISTNEVRNCVCKVLREKGLTDTARRYEEYKKNK